MEFEINSEYIHKTNTIFLLQLKLYIHFLAVQPQSQNSLYNIYNFIDFIPSPVKFNFTFFC